MRELDFQENFMILRKNLVLATLTNFTAIQRKDLISNFSTYNLDNFLFLFQHMDMAVMYVLLPMTAKEKQN